MIDQFSQDSETLNKLKKSIFFPLLENNEDLIIKSILIMEFHNDDVMYTIRITMKMDNPELFSKLQKIHESNPKLLRNMFDFHVEDGNKFYQSMKKIYPTRTVITKDVREDSIDKYNEIQSENKKIISNIDEALKPLRDLGQIINVEYPIKKIPDELFKTITYPGSIEFSFHKSSSFVVFLKKSTLFYQLFDR